jgi:hypothetical protein
MTHLTLDLDEATMLVPSLSTLYPHSMKHPQSNTSSPLLVPVERGLGGTAIRRGGDALDWGHA